MEKILGNVKKSIKRDIDVFLVKTSRPQRMGTEIMEHKYYPDGGDNTRWVKVRVEGNLILFAYYVKGSAVPMVVKEGTYGYFEETWNRFRASVKNWKKMVDEHSR